MNRHSRSSIPCTLALGGVVLLACTLAFASPAGAQTAARKFGRGLAGMAAGVLELPGNAVVETEKQGPAAGVPIGVAKGLGMIVARELIGVFEVVSAPFPVPAGFRPPLSPEFPWGYFEETQTTMGSGRRSHSEKG